MAALPDSHSDTGSPIEGEGGWPNTLEKEERLTVIRRGGFQAVYMGFLPKPRLSGHRGAKSLDQSHRFHKGQSSALTLNTEADETGDMVTHHPLCPPPKTKTSMP